MSYTLPNILTIIRLIAAPFVALVFVLLPRPLADFCAFILFVLASITDYLDGYLAREWKQESNFGRMLDPIADKAMVVISCAVVVGSFGLIGAVLIPISVILLREVSVAGLREFLGKDSSLLRVTKLAKWKTALQMVAISVLLLASGLDFENVYSNLTWLGIILLWAAALLTAITGIEYFIMAKPFLKDKKNG